MRFASVVDGAWPHNGSRGFAARHSNRPAQSPRAPICKEMDAKRSATWTRSRARRLRWVGAGRRRAGGATWSCAPASCASSVATMAGCARASAGRSAFARRAWENGDRTGSRGGRPASSGAAGIRREEGFRRPDLYVFALQPHRPLTCLARREAGDGRQGRIHEVPGLDGRPASWRGSWVRGHTGQTGDGSKKRHRSTREKGGRLQPKAFFRPSALNDDGLQSA